MCLVVWKLKFKLWIDVSIELYSNKCNTNSSPSYERNRAVRPYVYSKCLRKRLFRASFGRLLVIIKNLADITIWFIYLWIRIKIVWNFCELCDKIFDRAGVELWIWKIGIIVWTWKWHGAIAGSNVQFTSKPQHTFIIKSENLCSRFSIGFCRNVSFQIFFSLVFNSLEKLFTTTGAHQMGKKSKNVRLIRFKVPIKRLSRKAFSYYFSFDMNVTGNATYTKHQKQFEFFLPLACQLNDLTRVNRDAIAIDSARWIWCRVKWTSIPLIYTF